MFVVVAGVRSEGMDKFCVEVAFVDGVSIAALAPVVAPADPTTALVRGVAPDDKGGCEEPPLLAILEPS